MRGSRPPIGRQSKRFYFWKARERASQKRVQTLSIIFHSMATVPSPKKVLSEISPFKVLPSVELDRISQRLQTKTYDKGETIYSEGDPADSVWVVSKGRVQIFKYSSQGRPLAIENIAPGELFGTLCRLGSNGRNYPCTAIAAVESEVFRIADREF